MLPTARWGYSGLTLIREWLHNIKAASKKKEYARGYAWAEVAILDHQKNPDTLCPDCCIDRTDFDNCAQRACYDIGVLLKQEGISFSKIKRKRK